MAESSTHRVSEPEGARDLSIGTYEDTNGYKVKTSSGEFLGWVYPMDYIEGCEGTWGAISSAEGEVSDPTLYRQGFGDKHRAAAWLLSRMSD